VSEDLQLTDHEAVTSPIFTGEEEVFAFQRCVSRLSEMGGTKWSAFQEVADR
jgi:protein AFG1